ncbi:outer membrane protein assembly factor BamA [uncultured Flavobacterium sp.]|uniref:outer membrane protein assembly factor BamA n=1 Tax=uncultured Flavobacterium sp. TaxID=165435 RepID=UPI0030EBBAD2|tara:strand:+ start:76478 stop:79210 length:2733 start_codon:yes stop_codon:yes gene_type:complete
MKQLLVTKKENVDLEKQVNNYKRNSLLNKNIKYSAILFLFLGLFKISAQETDFENGKSYILADIEVTGKVNYNPQTIITFAGLEKGQSIIVPGEEISTAIKKLWKLGYFNDINVYVNKIQNDSIYLELNINELPKLADVKITGVKKGKKEELIKDNDLKKGKIVNENLITTTKNYIQNKYKKDGFYNTKVIVNTFPDSTDTNVDLLIKIDKGDKVKIKKINFEGNEQFSDKKLRKSFKNTKQQNPIRIFKASKFIKDKYEEDLTNVISKYKEKGYRDARIINDSVRYDKEKNKIFIDVKLEEGRKYYIGDIRFLGNTIYTEDYLRRILSINRGDVYNGVLLQKRIEDKTNPDAEDITNLYQNNGYLFSNINTVEVKTENDTIDFEIRISEGPLAYFNKITVVGNEKTNDHVIYREILTKPGKKYSKDALIRTIRELGQLGFFDPEAIDPKFKNVDAAAGTVDIEYNVVEKGASQIQLQGGYGGGGFIGTLGLSFNNFSIRNIFNKEAYKPLPMGDGQKMSLNLQASSYFRTYSLSFQEPWYGGKKPVSFSTSLSQSKQFLYNYSTRDVDKSQSFTITSLSVGIAKRLTVPDDYFTLSQAVSFQYYKLNNYNSGLFTFGNGASRNLAYTIGLTRNSKGINPIYPTYGSEFSVSAKFTPPYSLINGVDYSKLGDLAENKYVYDGTGYIYTDDSGAEVLVNNGDLLTALPSTSNPTPSKAYTTETAVADPAKVDQIKYKWLEYYKVKFKADWYTKVYDKLVLRSLGEFGFMGAYNQDRGLVPFERFYLGGDGLANYSLDGRETIQLRGYPNNSLSSNDGGTIYNKFSLELRYPITLKSSASIYALSFLEAGAAFNDFNSYNPFSVQRSAGFGLRVFMPAFGLLGIDFAHGFDAIPGATQKSGWQTHFIIGQQF